MPRNSSGQFNLLVNSWNPATNNVLASAGDYQALINDIAAALSQSVSNDGQTPMVGNLNMGNNKITGLSQANGTGQALAFEQLFAQGTQTDLASTATTDIGAQNTNFLRITGNTTITSFGSNFKGPRFLVFEGAVTLTNSSTLVLPGGANITTAAGDVLIAIPGATLGTADKWIVTSYQKANTAPGYANMPGGFDFRNRIINGDMRIDQRNDGASVTQNTSGTYTLDRWSCYGTVTSKFSVQQNAGSVTPPAGFTNYLGMTSLSAYSVGASDEFIVSQPIEGYNVADLGFGVAGAQSVTLSFWVRSSLTGTFGGALQSTGAGRSYPFSYTISAANTWEQKTITVAGDTTGTWNKTNGNGLAVYFGMGQGASKSAAAGSWVSGNYNNATGATSVVGTSGATFYLTGVQLEAGTVASPFERRDYGRELMMCQRYFCLFNSSTGAAYSSAGAGAQARSAFYFPVTMRSAPTITVGTMASSSNITSDSFSSITADAKGGTYEIVQGASAGNYFASRVDNKASSEL